MTAVVAATASAAASTPTDSSLRTHRVNCDRNDYLELHGNDGRDILCFADRGFIGVAIYGINWVESGNNKVNIQFQRDVNNPNLESVTLEKWRSWNPGHIHKVTRIEIY
ncbi:beta/gamma crystallin domain-containing protein [Streptomyces sp. NPDC059788]|uniref:beta/gamma crystallin domain-containing protein n=1 Tax=Streptomyces sp. NPDC059788 TaxID=3346948 RepID=UPI0036560075